MPDRYIEKNVVM